MNTQELELVMSMIEKLSGDASTAFIWYMALHYGTTVLGYLFTAFTILGSTWACFRFLLAGNEWAAYGRQCARKFGGRSERYGIQQDDWDAQTRAFEKLDKWEAKE